ncbi:MAG TPA: alpha/beta hydrolase [Myxococcaceae bacterium]|nr:alpha/beta hydrolase [Myxococcaceae bacterium]
MVMPGQFLERPALIPVDAWVLEGVSHRGTRRPPLLILPPSPAEGGSMDHVVGAELAWAVTREDHPTLRFNHRGIGASQGEPGDAAAWVEDVRAAMTVASENAGGAPVALAALGASVQTALAALDAAPERVAGLCLISPGPLSPDALRHRRLPMLMVLGTAEPTQGRLPLATALAEASGRLELVEDADATWTRGLPALGRIVARWLRSLEPHPTG